MMISWMSLDLVPVVLIELYKTRPSSSRKKTIKVAWMHGLQNGRDWFQLSNIIDQRDFTT